MFDNEFILRAILAVPALMLSFTVHEFFHAWTAYKFGDPTAKEMGRLTLNPLAHLDLLGTLMIFLSGFRFGWAKPVPVNPFNLRNPRYNHLWIAAAGPLSNLGLALIAGIVFRLVGFSLPTGLLNFLWIFIYMNVSLAFFNLLPLFPLDGFHILSSLLGEKYENALEQFSRYSPFILIALVVMGGLWWIIGPFVRIFVSLFTGISQ